MQRRRVIGQESAALRTSSGSLPRQPFASTDPSERPHARVRRHRRAEECRGTVPSCCSLPRRAPPPAALRTASTSPQRRTPTRGPASRTRRKRTSRFRASTMPRGVKTNSSVLALRCPPRGRPPHHKAAKTIEDALRLSRVRSRARTPPAFQRCKKYRRRSRVRSRPQVYHSTGSVDANGVQSVLAARAAGIKRRNPARA